MEDVTNKPRQRPRLPAAPEPPLEELQAQMRARTGNALAGPRGMSPVSTVLSICNVNHAPTDDEYSALRTLARNRFQLQEGKDYVDVEGLCRLLRRQLEVEGMELPDYLVEYVFTYTPTVDLRELRRVNRVYRDVANSVLRSRLLAELDLLEGELGDELPLFRRVMEKWRRFNVRMREPPLPAPGTEAAKLADAQFAQGEEAFWKDISEYLWSHSFLDKSQMPWAPLPAAGAGQLPPPRWDESRTLFSYEGSYRGANEKRFDKVVKGPAPHMIKAARRLLRAGMNPNAGGGIALEVAVATMDLEFLNDLRAHGVDLNRVLPQRTPWYSVHTLSPVDDGALQIRSGVTFTHSPLALLVKAVLNPLTGTPPLLSANTLLRLHLMTTILTKGTSPDVLHARDAFSRHGDPALNWLARCAAPGGGSDKASENALEAAAQVAKVALDNGYDPNATSSADESTLLHLTRNHAAERITSTVLKDREQRGRYPLLVDPRDMEDRTPLFYAAAARCWNVCQRLKAIGSDVNAKDRRQRNVFLYALQEDDKKLSNAGRKPAYFLQHFTLLKGMGMNPLMVDDTGDSALGYTVRKVQAMWDARYDARNGKLSSEEIEEIRKFAQVYLQIQL